MSVTLEAPAGVLRPHYVRLEQASVIPGLLSRHTTSRRVGLPRPGPGTSARTSVITEFCGNAHYARVVVLDTLSGGACAAVVRRATRRGGVRARR